MIHRVGQERRRQADEAAKKARQRKAEFNRKFNQHHRMLAFGPAAA